VAASPAGVLVAGNIVHDILVRPVEEIRWGTSVWVESIESHLGGNGANTSYCVAKLSVRARLLGSVGTDSFGTQCLDWLKSAGVDLSSVRRSPDDPTAATVGLVHPSGARQFLHRPGVSREAFVSAVEFPQPDIAGYGLFHLANVFALRGLRPHARGTLQNARAAGLITSLDTGWDPMGEWLSLIGPCLPFVDYLFVNEDEARMLTDFAAPAEAARGLLDRGAGCVVVKLGEKGCAIFGPSDTVFVPAFDVPCVDTTGAGDCFAGGFIAALARGSEMEDAALLANAAGALSISRLGAVEGLLGYQEVQEWIRATPRRAASWNPRG
jgi:sugar/nucleoside kinase (ribokinase family)